MLFNSENIYRSTHFKMSAQQTIKNKPSVGIT